MVGPRRTTMLRYFMIAMFCVIIGKSTVRIVHYANATTYSQASIH